MGKENKCLTCAEDADCPMIDMVKGWRMVLEVYGSEDNVPQEVFAEHYTDTPDCEDLVITWCPMYYLEDDEDGI